MEMVVLHPQENTARCRLLKGGKEILLHTIEIPRLVPGEVLTIVPRKRSSHADHPYFSGRVEKRRVDVPLLGLEPLRLKELGRLDPSGKWEGEEEDMDEDENRLDEPPLDRGELPYYAMERIRPALDPEDPVWDPILDAMERNEEGNLEGAESILLHLLSVDLRCLDAHAHLGSFHFETDPEKALSHYAVGAEIGALSCPPGFDGYLPWSILENRPFLRCLHGLGLCLWRTERLEKAKKIFEWNLKLNPADNQGVRYLLPHLREGTRWEDLPTDF